MSILTSNHDEWQTPRRLQSKLLPVTSFRLDLLPECLRDLVSDVAHRMQVAIPAAAVLIILLLAGAVGRRARIQPKAKDTTWQVVPNLWGGFIAAPGFMKSPTLNATMRPLVSIERELQEQYDAELEQYESLPAAERGDKPVPKRIIVNDSTFEKLHEILHDNPAGILVIWDELTGWLALMDKKGREGERAFFLTAWNGDSSHTIDRIGRGSVYVPACCISLVGGIQPDKLRTYLAGSANTNLQADGMIQRFQLLVWPDMEPDYEYVDRPPDTEAIEKVESLCRHLVGIEEDAPLQFRFADDAQECFITWLPELERRVRGSSESPIMTSHLSKYRSLMPSLALLFDIAERGTVPGFEGFDGVKGETLTVSLLNTERAVECCEWLETHARRIYGSIGTPQQSAAISLATKIRDREIGSTGFFTRREVAQRRWSGLDSPQKVSQAAELLIAAHVIRDATQDSGPMGGRPSIRYEVNPLVWASNGKDDEDID